MNISEIIKNQRKNKKFTQKELAKKINKSERMVQKYESGDVTPSIEVLNKIAGALEIDVNDLFKEYKTFSQNLIDELEYPLIKIYGPDDTLGILSSELNIDYDLLENNLNNQTELPEDILIRLIRYLSNIDYPLFMKFIEENRDSTFQYNKLKNEISLIMVEKLHDTKAANIEHFKKYLFIAFGNEVEEIVNDDNISELEVEVRKYLEFALYKLQNEGEQ